MKEKPSYYSILTANVRYDNRLSDSEKLLFAEITSLTQANGVCWAGNKYFAELYGVHEKTISKRIAKLKRLNYIEVDMLYKNGTKQVDKRVIKITKTCEQIGSHPPHANAPTPPHANATGNNTSNEYYKINKKNGERRFTPPSLEEVANYCNERNNNIDPQSFIDFYSSKGWYVGKNKMKDWKASIRTWERRDNKNKPKAMPVPVYTKINDVEIMTMEEEDRLNKELEAMIKK